MVLGAAVSFTVLAVTLIIRLQPTPPATQFITLPTARPTPTPIAMRPSQPATDGKLRFGRIVIAPNPLILDPQRLVNALPVHQGTPFSLERLDSAADALTFAAGGAGYAAVDVTAKYEVDASSHLVNVTFDIMPGPKVYVSHVDVVGSTSQLRYTLVSRGGEVTVESARTPETEDVRF